VTAPDAASLEIPIDGSAGETVIAELVDVLRHAPDGAQRLAALLPENLPLYEGRSASETTRLRGYLLAALADTGVPPGALPFLVESLESGHDAYEVAGAAIGLRGLRALTGSEIPALLTALHNLDGADATVSFERHKPCWPYAEPTTAVTEVVRTIGMLGAGSRAARADLERFADQQDRLSARVLTEIRRVLDPMPPQAGEGDQAGGCGPGCGCGLSADQAGTVGAGTPPVDADAQDACCGPDQVAPTGTVQERRDDEDGAEILVQDQDGLLERFEEFYRGRPSVLAFFYTRCDNPYKCSLTITRLAAVQRALDERGLAGGVRVTAVTYDPEFDLPHRLKLYGEHRGMRFGETARFFRAVSGFDRLRRRFDLRANYGPSTVNRHQIELHVLDEQARVRTSFTRLQWQVDDVVRAVEELAQDIAGSRSRWEDGDGAASPPADGASGEERIERVLQLPFVAALS
jgi:cytochrome oxidase Cu insertion factor (SCO1/SenC/PrrC family)